MVQCRCIPATGIVIVPLPRPGSLVVFSSLFYFILYSIFCFSNSSPDLSSCCYSCTLDCTSHAARCTRHLGLPIIGHQPYYTPLRRITNILEKKQTSDRINKEWVLYPSHLLHLHMHPRRRCRVSQHPSTSATSTSTMTTTMTPSSTPTPTPTQTHAATKPSISRRPPTAAQPPVHHQAQSQGSSSAASPASSSSYTCSTCR